MPTIPYSTFSDWIRSQPDDRPINMLESYELSSCGCIMIQYAREHDIPVTSVGLSCFFDSNKITGELDHAGSELVRSCIRSSIKNFAEVKSYL